MLRTILCVAIVSFLSTGATHATDDVLPPNLAASRAGEKATIEFHVESSKLLSDRESPICFLNSTKNHWADDTFTVVMFSEALARFAEADIKNPAEHFSHKTIQVTGEIGLRQGKPQIIVDYVGQIELANEQPSKD